MKSKSSITYIIKNFIFLVLPASVAALTLGIFNDGKSGFSFYTDFFKDLDTFSYLNKPFYEVFSYFSPINFSNIWISLLCLVSIIISCGVIICSVERHMRLGVRSASRWLVMLNDSFLLVFPFLLLNLLLLELIALVATSVIVLLGLALKGAWLFAVSGILVGALYMAFVIVFLLLICTVPSMLSDGYSFRFAASYSANIVSQSLGKFILHLIMVLCVSVLLKWLFGYLLGAFSVPIDVIFYMFWVMYVPVFAMKSYINLTGGERKDIKAKYFAKSE